MTQIYVHIGLPKTGTTFLQRQVFPKLDLVFLDDPSDSTKNPSYLLKKNLWANWTEADVDRHVEAISGFLDNVVRMNPNADKILWSWEGLVGESLLGYINQEKIAEVLKRCCPDAKIILTLRRQDSYAESIYVQTIHNYCWGSPADFILRDASGSFSPYEFSPIRPNPAISVCDLDWNGLLDIYESRFGKDQMLVLPYEQLRGDYDGFMASVLRFMDNPALKPIVMREENRSYSQHSFVIARFLNRFTREGRSPFPFIINRPFCERLLPHIATNRVARLAYGVFRRLDLRRILQEYVDRIYWTPNRAFDATLKAEILNRHKNANAVLDRRLGGSLAKYGYF